MRNILLLALAFILGFVLGKCPMHEDNNAVGPRWKPGGVPTTVGKPW